MRGILKGVIAASMATLLSFCLAGCGGPTASDEIDDESTPAEEIAESSIPTVKIGQTVSSDILDFTLNNVELAYYSNGSVSAMSSSGLVVNADTCLMPEDEKVGGSPLVANKGHVLVCLDFTVKNNNRGSIHICDTFDGTWLQRDLSINYGGEKFLIRSYDLNNPDGKSTLSLYDYTIKSEDNGETWYRSKSSNEILDAGEEIRIRLVGIACFEPSQLSDSFTLEVNMLNSSDERETFAYSK